MLWIEYIIWVCCSLWEYIFFFFFRVTRELKVWRFSSWALTNLTQKPSTLSSSKCPPPLIKSHIIRNVFLCSISQYKHSYLSLSQVSAEDQWSLWSRRLHHQKHQESDRPCSASEFPLNVNLNLLSVSFIVSVVQWLRTKWQCKALPCPHLCVCLSVLSRITVTPGLRGFTCSLCCAKSSFSQTAQRLTSCSTWTGHCTHSPSVWDLKCTEGWSPAW